MRLSQVEPPLLEWRLAPTSARNKDFPDIPLSQVYLTFAKSRTSPNNPPTFRLWLAGSIQGQRKRILLAFSKMSLNKQRRATIIKLCKTEKCLNTRIEFELKVLPGIHFFQSNVPYKQADQSNIWALWAPSAEILASTPGREKIIPPPPSPRNQPNL